MTPNNALQRTCRLFIFFTATLVVGGCYSERFDRGDGVIVDNGFLVWMGGRYVLNLGEVDLTTSGVYEFSMDNLPPRYHFVIGIVIDGNLAVLEQSKTSVDMRLIRNDEIVVSVSGPIGDWVHYPRLGGTYAYQRGDEEEPRGRDCSRGTYFIPRAWRNYSLEIEIKPIGNEAISNATIELHSAGHSFFCP